jgi:hypothetical protein
MGVAKTTSSDSHTSGPPLVFAPSILEFSPYGSPGEVGAFLTVTEAATSSIV